MLFGYSNYLDDYFIGREAAANGRLSEQINRLVNGQILERAHRYFRVGLITK